MNDWMHPHGHADGGSSERVDGEHTELVDEPDTREKLEADVRKFYTHTVSTAMWPPSANKKTDMLSAPIEAILGWLDRQEAITDREWETEQAYLNDGYKNCIADLTAERDDLRRRVGDLTRQLDNLAHDLDHVALPLDADYVPIHLGDTLEVNMYEGKRVGQVTGMRLNSGGWIVAMRDNFNGIVRTEPKFLRRPGRKMTDLDGLLEDLIVEWQDTDIPDVDLYEKYAGKIRELLGVEA